MNLQEIRAKYPQYDVLSDDELARALHQKFYPQLEFKDFSSRVGYLKGARPDEYDPESPEFREKYGATSGMGGVERFRAGVGKGLTDLARGAGQLVGLISRDDISESRQLDRDLMDTGAGTAGALTGTVAGALPAMFVPGANTMAGSAAVGAGLGVLQPSESTKETLQNVALGGVLSPAALAGGRALSGGWRGAKALAEPFTKGGQERIAARTLEAFAGGRDAAQQAAQNVARNRQNVLPGIQPTTAELADNAGLAQLERTLRNNPEYMTALTERSQANRGVIMDTLEDIAGDSSRMEAAKAARKAASSPLYEAAKEVKVKVSKDLSDLLRRPSMKGAWDRARKLAAEAGDSLETEVTVSNPGRIVPLASEPAYSGKALHYLKMSMDDIADNPEAAGIGAHEARSINDTRAALLNQIEEQIPQYRQARETYASMSQPINQMEIGAVLRDKLQPALAEFGGNTRLRPEMYARALREGDATATKALGRNSASMEKVMSPEQMRKLRLIGEQLARRTNADELGRAVGSNTGQNMVSQNILRQFLGPLGLPESTLQRVAESTLLQSIMRPAQFVGKLGEQRAMSRLAEAAMDPQVAEELLRLGVPPDKIGLLRYQAAFGPVTASGANSAKE